MNVKSLTIYIYPKQISVFHKYQSIYSEGLDIY